MASQFAQAWHLLLLHVDQLAALQENCSSPVRALVSWHCLACGGFGMFQTAAVGLSMAKLTTKVFQLQLIETRKDLRRGNALIAVAGLEAQAGEPKVFVQIKLF